VNKGNYKRQGLALEILVLVGLMVSPALAQVASHEPAMKATSVANATPATASANANLSPVQPVMNKPVVRVNGTELTDRDLLREMLTIFPYARQHNGFPKAEEEKIRTGALKMIEFEELVYQEAQRRGMTVPPAKLDKAYSDYRAQFPTEEMFNEYLKTEMHGSKQLLRKQIRRSLLIDAMLKAEVADKAKVSLTEARAYYDKNPNVFRYGETFSIQTISVMPPEKAGEDAKKEARKRAEEACQKAKATKSYEEFGLLAEKSSEDDFHVNMGDHKAVDREKLPPEIVTAALAMQPGQVSELIQLGNFYTCFRLDAHTPAGKYTFEQVKDKLREELSQEKFERLRAGLDKKLRQNAKVQEL
jgi:parvulin-like peptidyl-prolyl isomerase